MKHQEKLNAILAAVQTDPGRRGLARDPNQNLFTTTTGDFHAACASLANTPGFRTQIYTGFCIPTTQPPMFETDGPLGAYFLERAFAALSGYTEIFAEEPVLRAIQHARRLVQQAERTLLDVPVSHKIVIERAGRAEDGRRYSMSGRDVSLLQNARITEAAERQAMDSISIGIGDGGNEIGMGKIPHDTIVANIPNGDLIHCRIPTNHLIVAGVSNWGAYALAAGVFVLRGIKPPAELFNPDREREILEIMVREGPLIDGVTGMATVTVDGLSWDEYSRPLIRIQEILKL